MLFVVVAVDVDDDDDDAFNILVESQSTIRDNVVKLSLQSNWMTKFEIKTF